MKGLLLKVVGVVGVVVLILAGAAVSVGGLQMVRVLRGPELPVSAQPGSPATDLAFLRDAVIANEHGATPAQLDRFNQIIAEAPAPATSEELTLVAARALAALDNAHTTLMSPTVRQLPLRFHWTADALIVVKARPAYEALLGRQILALGGVAPHALIEPMSQFVGGGTPGWMRYRSEYYLSAPAALAALGASVRDGAVEVRTVDAHGAEETIVMLAEAEPTPGDPFWDFLHAFPGDTHFGTEGWLTLLQVSQELPLYLREPERLYLFADLPEHEAVYVRMNGAINDEDESVAQFTERVLDQVGVGTPQNIIVDFRYNRGGDYTAVLPLVRSLSTAVPAGGRLYLITGPNTFSAGILAGSQFKRFIPDRLIVVGEDVGDRLRFRGEGMVVTLPATGMQVYLSTAWDDVANDCGWFADCWPPNKYHLRGVNELHPDIRAANTWASYREARDLAIEAVLTDIGARQD